MKVSWSVLVGDARGTTGTITAFNSKSGPCLRGRSIFRGTSTPDQLQTRAAFATVAQLWRSATMNPYRFDWNALAYAHTETDVFGNLIRKTGFAWFTRCNKTLETFGLPPILAAPAFVAPEDPTTVTLTYDIGPPWTLTVDAAVAPLAGDAVIIKATRAISAGRALSSNLAKIVFTENPGTTGPWDISTAYAAKFPDPIPGLQIFAQVYYINIASGYPGPHREGAALI